jgi:two-component system sensor kinase FixL
MLTPILPPPVDDTGACEDLEIEVQQLRKVLAHLTRLSAIGTTAAMLVHELAQPVTAASNYLAATQRLLATDDAASTKRVREGVELAQECLARAAELMGSVKEAAASKAFRPRPVSLKVIIGDVMRLYAVGLNFPVKTEIAPAAARVFGDRVQLAQVFSNLIRNAAEVTEGQAERALTVTAAMNEEKMVEVCITDNGRGLPPELREKLFSPFNSTKADGLGVGLSICRTIIEQHGGRIWANSLTVGTAFCFTLTPASAKAAEPRDVASGVTAGRGQVRVSGLEDDQVLTPEAALETAARLSEAAVEAKGRETLHEE